MKKKVEISPKELEKQSERFGLTMLTPPNVSYVSVPYSTSRNLFLFKRREVNEDDHCGAGEGLRP